MFFKRKNKFPENTKYKKGDFVNFRYRGELYFGYIHDAKEVMYGKITYTIQIGGQCPASRLEAGSSDFPLPYRRGRGCSLSKLQ